MVAKQWMWKIEQPNGVREIDEIHVPADKPVRLSMTSQDVIHSLFLPALRLKQDVLPEPLHLSVVHRATKPAPSISPVRNSAAPNTRAWRAASW